MTLLALGIDSLRDFALTKHLIVREALAIQREPGGGFRLHLSVVKCPETLTDALSHGAFAIPAPNRINIRHRIAGRIFLKLLIKRISLIVDSPI